MLSRHSLEVQCRWTPFSLCSISRDESGIEVNSVAEIFGDSIIENSRLKQWEIGNDRPLRTSCVKLRSTYSRVESATIQTSHTGYTMQ